MNNNRLVHVCCLLVMLGIFLAPQMFGAESWRILLADPANYYAVRFVAHETGWIVGSGGAIRKTTDAGATWLSQTSGTTVTLTHLWFVNASTGWVVGDNGTILKTTNGGSSWLPQSSSTTAALKCVYFRDAQVGWIGGANGTFLKTNDGGATWTSAPLPTTATVTGGWSPAMNKIVLTCSDGTALRTSNDGVTWQTQWLNNSLPMNAVHFVDANYGWAVGANGRVKMTSSGGDVWYIQESGTTENLYAVYFINSDTGWVAGSNGLVKWTTNGGATWSVQNSFATETLRGLWFLSGQHGYAVGMNTTVREYGFNPLPVQLASFTATVLSGNAVRLDWRTVGEVNNYGFEVQRAENAPANFATIPGSFIPGHGATGEPHDYTFTDVNVPNGRLSYRLKQIDLDGSVHHSEPIVVDVLTGVGDGEQPTRFALKQNYPNPFNPTTTIEFSLAQPSVVSLKVYNTLGEEGATLVAGELREGNYRKVFDASSLSSGVYLYKLTAGSFVQTRKLMLMK